MMFAWLDTRAAQRFAEELARSFIGGVPKDSSVSDRKFEAKARAALGRLDRQIAAFRHEHHLNFYQKARLGNTFKWTLKGAGFDGDYVDKLTDLLMLRLQ